MWRLLMNDKINPFRIATRLRRLLASESFFPTNDPLFIQWKKDEPNIIETLEEFITDFGSGKYHITFGEVKVTINGEDFTMDHLDMTLNYGKDVGWYKHRIFTEIEEITISEHTLVEAQKRAEIIKNKIMGLMGDLSEIWETIQVLKRV